MKIKHFAGYGNVNANKLVKKDIDGKTILVVMVTGSHECGMTIYDSYTIYNWIVTKFEKRAVNITSVSFSCLDTYEYNPERVIYTIEYQVNE